MRLFVKIAVRVLAAVVVLLIIGGLAGLVVVQSGWFHEYVRQRIIAEIERATGGRADLGRFSFRGATLTASIAPLVLHGREGPGEPPLLQVDSVSVGLRVISLLEHKVDVSSVQVKRPLVRIAFYADGSNNVPSPGARMRGQSWAQDMLNLKVGQYEIADGVVEFDDRKIPLNLRGEGLAVRVTYDPQKPSYQGNLSSQRLRVLPGGLTPFELGVAGQFVLDAARVTFSSLRFSTKETRADLTGALEDLRRPRGNFKVRASGTVRELVKMFPMIPIQPVGSAQFDGRVSVTFAQDFSFGVSGRANARGLSYSRDRLKISGADVRADVNLGPDRLALSGVQATALGARFEGAALVTKWRLLHVEGNFDGLSVAEAARIVTDRPMPWNGTLAGDVMLDNTIGQPDVLARANVLISPASTGPPIQGRFDAVYDQRTDQISLASSYVATPATRIDATGTLGKTMQVQFRSTNLDDVLPALALVEEQPPQAIPLKLKNGSATANGTVLGTVENPRFQGQVSVVNGSIEGHGFDRFSGDVDATRTVLAASRFTLSRAATQASGSATISARQNSFEDAAVTAQLNLRNANLAELVKEGGGTLDATGTASADIRVNGSVRQPRADLTIDVDKPAAFGERLDRVHATLRVLPGSVDVSGGEAEDGPGRLRFSGTYQHPDNDWKSGETQFQVTAQNLPMTRIEALTAAQPRLDARLSADLRGRGRLSNATFTLTSVAGTASAQSVTIDREPLGEVALTVDTRGSDVAVTARGKLQETSFEGQGSWRLEGDEPGSGTVKFSRMSIDSLHRLAVLGGAAPPTAEGLTFDGFVEGHATVMVALRKLPDVQAELTLDAVQLNAKPGQTLPKGVQQQDVVVRNSQPVLVDVGAKEARIRSARFTARDTNIEASGTIPFTSAGGADIAVRGGVNLVILQLLSPDLQARGNATVQASLRGTLANPLLNGRMELKGASLYLADLPNGVDNASGVVVFDRNRATIEKLTAETGGGSVALTGFVGFGTPLAYRLQANARDVRVRLSDQDLSTTFGAELALNGTSDASTVSGTVTLERAAFTPRTDLVELLASAAKPVPAAATPNEYLRGMQLDVRIESAPNFEFQTSLTRDVEAEVDLRLRGTPLRPVLLGTISVSQGEVQVLGNRYTINRGDIRFLNPVKMEPVFDVDLETRARGVTVNISFTGTMQKLNPNYSSDPPLQTSEIIALLAVGRPPTSTGGLASAQVSSSSANFMQAGGSLLSQAVSAQLSSRLQRFFGATRVKIDPTMTGVENTPQARLTFEQQVSKDITLTYITNLNYTQEQIVRLEWDLNRNWSAVAVRDANGLFGIDFQYRKRFK